MTKPNDEEIQKMYVLELLETDGNIEPELQPLAYEAFFERIVREVSYTEGAVAPDEVLNSDPERKKFLEFLRLGKIETVEQKKQMLEAWDYFIRHAIELADSKASGKQRIARSFELSVAQARVQAGIATPSQQKMFYEWTIRKQETIKEEAMRPKKHSDVFMRNFDIYYNLKLESIANSGLPEFTQNAICARTAKREGKKFETVLREYQKWKKEPKNIRKSERLIKSFQDKFMGD